MSGLFPFGKNYLQSILDGETIGMEATDYLRQVAITAREVREKQRAYYKCPHSDAMEKKTLLIESKGAEAVLDRLLNTEVEE